MRLQLSARHSLFLHVRTHAQLQYYLDLTETRRAANECTLGLRGAAAAPRFGKVVEMHPRARSTRNR